jgi:DNA-binding MarR family transcriptional regulator
MIPRLVPNPAATGSEISLEADEWRVLTMVNGKNTVGYIAQRSGLGESRTGEIITRLLSSGLIERRDVSLSESLFPELDRLVLAGLGSSARALLQDSYTRANIRDQNSATLENLAAALDLFEPAATRAFGAARVRQPIAEMRALVEQVFSSMP